MKKLLLLLLVGVYFIPVSSWGQTTQIFLENFNRAALSTGGPTTYTTTVTAGDGGAAINSSTFLRITNDNSGTANANGGTYVTGLISDFSSPFNSTLHSNTGIIEWTFNFKYNRTTNPSGLGLSGSYGTAIVLAGSNSSIHNTGSGYAIVYGNSGTTDPIKLIKYNNGLTGTITEICTSAALDISAVNNYVSVRVVFNPSGDLWSLFVRDDGASAWGDPTSGVTSQKGSTIADNTYTSISMTNFGFYWVYSTAATQTSDFDNFKVILTPAATPTITTNSSMTQFSQTSSTASASQSFTVSGINLSTDISVVAPSNFQVSNDNATWGGSTTITQTGGTVTNANVYVRMNASSAGYYSGNVVCSSTGASDANVTATGLWSSTYYSAAAGNIYDLTSWGTNTDGTGTNPSNFTAGGQTFNVVNRSSASSASWTVSGTSTKIVVGDGTNPCTFTIASGSPISVTVDVTANSTLTINDNTPPTLGTVSASSTVEYAGTGSSNIQVTSYGNLLLTNGTKVFGGNTTTVSGNLVFNNCTLSAPGASPFATISLGGNLTYQGTVTNPADANSITLSTTGTGTQTITGNGNTARFFRLTTNNSGNNIVLSTTGGSTNLTVGNATSGGTSLATGTTLTVNSNTVSFFAGGPTLQGLGTFTCSSSSNISLSKTVTTSIGTLYLTSGSSTLNNLTINLNGSSNNILTLGSDCTVNGTLTLTNGTLAVGSNTLTLASTATAQCNTNTITGAGTFTLSSGSTLVIGSTAGISSSGATGNIQTTTRNFNAGAIYSYNGGSQQNTGNGLPSTITGYLAVDQSSGLILDVPVTVAGLHLNNGKILLGSNDVIITDELTSSDFNTMYVVTDGVGVLKKAVAASASYNFPIGTTSAYSPVSITNNGVSSDDFSARVAADASGNNSGADRVKLLWTLGRAGSSAYTPTFSWPSSAEGATFSANRATYAKLYDINNTASPIAAVLTGSDPYSLAAGTTVNSNTSFGIGDSPTALPVQLVSFSASLSENVVLLNWATATEVNNYGFSVERKVQSEEWAKIAFVNGSGNSNSPKNYTFTDNAVPAGKVQYRLKQIDFDGKFEYSNVAEVNVEAPSKLALYQNMPNPFNPSTEIKFSLPKNGNVELSIYNMLGEKIETLINKEMNAGDHKVTFNANNLSSGVYLYKLTTENITTIKKMILMK